MMQLKLHVAAELPDAGVVGDLEDGELRLLIRALVESNFAEAGKSEIVNLLDNLKTCLKGIKTEFCAFNGYFAGVPLCLCA